MNLNNFIAVAVGGAVGASIRYAINIFVAKNYTYHIPIATMFVNLFGSLVVGVLFAVFSYTSASNTSKLILITGLLGSLTTYSAFAIETLMLSKVSFGLAGLNIFINLFGSILFVFLGFKITIIFHTYFL